MNNSPQESGTAHTQSNPREELILTGGRFTAGVVRVGDTVRRPTSPSSPFVARLLTHLMERGFPGAPSHLGQDEKGRDIFSYIPGWVPEKFQYFNDGQIQVVAKLIRSFHDATRDCELGEGKPVICHNDPGPNNTVFRDGVPIAFIDFDFAKPGEPLEDLGYMAWSWCISSKPARGPIAIQADQVRVLADAYGLDAQERQGILDSVMARQSQNMEFWSSRIAGFNGPPTSCQQIEERIMWSERELEFTRMNRDTFLSALR